MDVGDITQHIAFWAVQLDRDERKHKSHFVIRSRTLSNTLKLEIKIPERYIVCIIFYSLNTY